MCTPATLIGRQHASLITLCFLACALTISSAAPAQHWAFVSPPRPALPRVQNTHWPRNPVDYFILEKLEQAKLAVSPGADRATLIRRVSLDLLGLPPTIEEVDAFVNDRRPDAYERLVDCLLQSPHYGERWGRHWLDQARYADSNGYSIDAARNLWRWRDWVIAALNSDMPFDQFTIEQLAGDLIPNTTIEQKIATGFHRNTLINQEGGIDLEQFRVESIHDRVSTTGTVWLGLTIGCAQCHNHKFDPILQREYYQLFAFFNNCDEPNLEVAAPEEVAQRDSLRKEIAALTKKLTAAKKNNAIDAKRLEAELDELKKREPLLASTMVLREMAQPRETTVFIKGDFTRRGERVGPGVPAVLQPNPPTPFPNREGGGARVSQSNVAAAAEGGTSPGSPFPNREGGRGVGLSRLDLARWLVSSENPLTARVTVNRMWMRYFGKGLVETENDFGKQGTPPTHPQLLDWLATEFVRQGWSMKAIHRVIVTSATYRQSSKHRADVARVDPSNKLLALQNRLRLEAEIIRDNALAASGLMCRNVGGPSVFPPQPDGVYRLTQVDKKWKPSAGADRYRRGMYTHVWRSAPHPGLTVFDAPDGVTCCTRRNRSNTPLQALTMLNDEAYVEFAEALAGRVIREVPSNEVDRLRYAFRRCLAREPSAVEAQCLMAVLASEFASERDTRNVWTTVARVLMNLDEFVTRE